MAHLAHCQGHMFSPKRHTNVSQSTHSVLPWTSHKPVKFLQIHESVSLPKQLLYAIVLIHEPLCERLAPEKWSVQSPAVSGIAFVILHNTGNTLIKVPKLGMLDELNIRCSSVRTADDTDSGIPQSSKRGKLSRLSLWQAAEP